MTFRIGGLRRACRFQFALVLATLAAAAVPQAAQAGSPFSFGFADNAPGWGTVSANDHAYVARRAGASLHRLVMRWDGVEPTKGAWRLDPWDRIYSTNRAYGISTVLTVMSAPEWARLPDVPCASNGECNQPPKPEHLADWANFIKVLVRRYPGLGGIEIWNEPNIRRYWQTGLDPAYYATLVKTAHQAARSVGSTVPILGGGLSNWAGPDIPEAMDAANFLRRMYAAGVKGYMDGVAVHPYPNDLDLWRTFKTLTEIREVIEANGDAMKLWLTELGITTSGDEAYARVSENDQGVLHVRLLKYFRAAPDVRAVMINSTLEQTQWGMDSDVRGYGVMKANRTPKPAYCGLAAYHNTGYVCPLLVKKPVADATQDKKWLAQEMLQRATEAARTYRRRTGSYQGLTQAQLHAIDPWISTVPPELDRWPGDGSHESRVAVFVTPEGRLTMCNASRADKTYCLDTAYGQPWRYGNTTGPINYTRTALANGWTSTW